MQPSCYEIETFFLLHVNQMVVCCRVQKTSLLLAAAVEAKRCGSIKGISQHVCRIIQAPTFAMCRMTKGRSHCSETFGNNPLAQSGDSEFSIVQLEVEALMCRNYLVDSRLDSGVGPSIQANRP